MSLRLWSAPHSAQQNIFEDLGLAPDLDQKTYNAMKFELGIVIHRRHEKGAALR